MNNKPAKPPIDEPGALAAQFEEWERLEAELGLEPIPLAHPETAEEERQRHEANEFWRNAIRMDELAAEGKALLDNEPIPVALSEPDGIDSLLSAITEQRVRKWREAEALYAELERAGCILYVEHGRLQILAPPTCSPRLLERANERESRLALEDVHDDREAQIRRLPTLPQGKRQPPA